MQAWPAHVQELQGCALTRVGPWNLSERRATPLGTLHPGPECTPGDSGTAASGGPGGHLRGRGHVLALWVLLCVLTAAFKTRTTRSPLYGEGDRPVAVPGAAGEGAGAAHRMAAGWNSGSCMHHCLHASLLPALCRVQGVAHFYS